MFHVVKEVILNKDKKSYSCVCPQSLKQTFEAAAILSRKLAVENAHWCVVASPQKVAEGEFTFTTYNSSRVTYKVKEVE